jgi:hypothetical protein
MGWVEIQPLRKLLCKAGAHHGLSSVAECSFSGIWAKIWAGRFQ